MGARHLRLPITTEEELEAAANNLCARYNCAILAKGGHVGGNTCTDILVQPGKPTLRWSHPRTEGISTHGTGCTLSSAITAFLAKGQPLEQAVENGLSYIANAIATSHKLGEQFAVNHSI